MASDEFGVEWRIVGASVCGASHLRAGARKQDAIAWLPQSENILPLIVAVSDGHGSAKCFRSDLGAAFAVETATNVIHEFATCQSDMLSPLAMKEIAEEQLSQKLVQTWQMRVEEALKNNPLSEAELSSVQQKDGLTARQTVEANPLLAYGATLLSVVVTNSFIVYLQLGDGDILTVTEEGEVSRPLPRDDRLFANETTSLCSVEAWRDIRVSFQVQPHPPALILLATDGYANSFRDDNGFRKVGSDLLTIIRTDGLEKVSDSLEGWLTETTMAGSGDDVTLGIVCRMDAVTDLSIRAT